MINNDDLGALDAHFREMQKLAEHFNSQIRPLLEYQEDLKKAYGQIDAAYIAIREAIEPVEKIQRQLNDAGVKLIESTRPFPDLSPIISQFSEYQKKINDAIAPAFEEYWKSFHDLPPRTQEALLVLGEHGWYLDMEMPLPGLWELRRALSEGEVSEAEAALTEYFEGRVDAIEKSIISRFPNRAAIITAAFNAHRRQEFELSIPVLLAQTDGICKEVVNQYFFIRDRLSGKPGTAIYVNQLTADTFKAAILSPLAKILPINESKGERPKDFKGLNRHMVLHGDSLDYPSKVNSLKAISLINYVAQVLKVDAGDS